MLDLKQSQRWHEQQVNEGGPQATHPLYIYPGQVAPGPCFRQGFKIMNFTTPGAQAPPFIKVPRLLDMYRQFPNHWTVDCLYRARKVNKRGQNNIRGFQSSTPGWPST